MRILRLLLFFDLPVSTPSARKEAALFRKFLIEDGYIMEQYSVYSRIAICRSSAETHISRLKKNLPTSGAVTLFVLSESQYARRQLLVTPVAAGTVFHDEGQMTLMI